MIRFDPLSDPSKIPRKKQLLAYKAIDRGENLLVVLPTSYGKTNIALYLAQQTRDSGKRFIVGVPLKALVEEHYTTFSTYFSHIVKISGDYRENREIINDPETDGYIMTYEMIYQMFLKEDMRDQLLENVNSLIIDEAHLMGIESRGSIIESLIYLTHYFYPDLRLLLLSATIGNPAAMAAHFQLRKIFANESERPIPLQKEIKITEGITDKLSRIKAIHNQMQEILGVFLPDKHPRCLVFCPSRDEAEKLAQICRFLTIGKKEIQLRTDFHHAGRRREEKIRVENEFREGRLDLVCCTPTLAMGINMPCDIVVISSVRRWNPLTSDSEILPSSELIQMMGRAGRPGQLAQLEFGKAVILCSSKDYSKVSHLINGSIKIRSQINFRIEYVFITWIRAGLISHQDLFSFYNRIFLPETEKDESFFNRTIEWLRQNNFIQFNGSEYELLPFGVIVANFAIEPQTVVYLNEFLNWFDAHPIPDLALPTLFGMIMGNDEFCNHIRVNEKIDASLLKNAEFFMDSHCAFPFFNKIRRVENWTKIQKGSMLIYGPYIKYRYFDTEEFQENLTQIRTDGDFTTLIEDARRILLATKAIFQDYSSLRPKIDLLWKGIEGTMPVFDADLIRLLYIPGLDLHKILILYYAGIHNFNDLLKAQASELASRISQVRQNSKNFSYESSQLTSLFLERVINASLMMLDQLRKTICILPVASFKSETLPKHPHHKKSTVHKSDLINLHGKDSENSIQIKKSCSDGFCILCGTAIEYNIYQPLCAQCRRKKSKFTEIPGTYCHKCGRENANISSSKPLDFHCWAEENSEEKLGSHNYKMKWH